MVDSLTSQRTPLMSFLYNLVEGEDDGDAKEPNEADDDVQGGHPLLVPRTKSDNHQLEGNGI